MGFEAVGDKAVLNVKTLNNQGKVKDSSELVTVEAIRGGGFYGRVLLFNDRDYVLKTTSPEPFHEFMRLASWGLREFPPKVSELAAQHDHLTTDLIAAVLPVVTNGQFRSPSSYGYTQLESGYGQLIQKVQGRGPRFKPENEFPKYRDAQRQLRPIAYELGLEQAAQIHEDNPFGMENLWFDDAAGGFVWLDTLVAFKHEPLFGVMRYKFHQDLCRHFHPNSPEKPIFNRIHVDQFLAAIAQHEKCFDPEDYAYIKERAGLYQDIRQKLDQEPQTKINFKAAATSLVKAGAAAAPKVIKGAAETLLIDPVRITFSSEYRLEEALKGAERAFEHGIISEAEMKQAAKAVLEGHKKDSASPRKRLASALMLGLYGASFLGVKGVQGLAVYLDATSDQDLLIKSLAAVPILAGGQILSSGSRWLSTIFAGLVTGEDLRAAAAVSLFPIIGASAPFTVKEIAGAAGKDGLALHYTVRDFIAKLSSFHPAGGSYTQFEGDLYRKLGTRIESLTQGS